MEKNNELSLENQRLLTLSNARLEGETFEEYKYRRKLQNTVLKEYAKGKYRHKSKHMYDDMLGNKGKTFLNGKK